MELNKWKNPRPKKFYPKIVKLLGEPAFKSNVPGGMVYWKTRGLFNEHLLRDEEISHCVPARHHDYFYSSIRCYVPPNKRKDVLSISGSINYDGLKKLLTARCASINANIATLYLGMCVANNIMDIKDVKAEGLYGKYIRGEMEPHKELRRQMWHMKRNNNKKYKHQIKGQFDPLAFPNC